MADDVHGRLAPQPPPASADPGVDPLAPSARPPTPEPPSRQSPSPQPPAPAADKPGGLDALLGAAGARPAGARPAQPAEPDSEFGQHLPEALRPLRNRLRGAASRPVRSGGATGRNWADRWVTSARARDVALSLLVVLAAVSVVLATRSGRSASPDGGGDQPTVGTSAAPMAGAVRVLATERAAAGGMTLTVTVPGAPPTTALSPSAFTVDLDGTPAAATVERVPPTGQFLAVVVDTSAGATRADLQTAGNGLTELGLQLPPASRVAVIGTAGPTLLQPMTADVTTAVKALGRVTPTGPAAAGAALRLAAQQVASAPRLHRAVLVQASGTVGQQEQGVIDVALSAQLAGTPVFLVGAASGSDGLRSALATTGGAVYPASADAPLAPYDALAADFTNQYRLTFPAPATPVTATVRVSAPGLAGSVVTTADPRTP